MKKILVPVDGSEYARRAIIYAARRAAPAKATVHVLHVEAPIDYAELRAYVMRKEMKDIRRKAAERILARATSRLKKERVRHVARMRESDDIAAAIAQYVKAQRIDQVVMGTRGMGALGTFVLGSVANRVVHLVRVPVTLVH
jgi:nucleotide-binding universal stress UspA family protein